MDRLVAAWNELDFPAVRALWHPSEQMPWYLPEEETDFLMGWDAIEAYWARTRSSIKRLTMRTWNVNAKPMADDLIVLLYEMHWNAEVEGYPKPCGGDNRVTALMRKGDEDLPWRFCHYVEAPLAPIMYLRRYYEECVDESFLS